MVFTFDQLKELLFSRWHYKPKQLESTVIKLLNMDPSLVLAFEKYIMSNEFPNLPIYFGLSPREISEYYPFKPPAVFLCLDWIRRDPHNAIEALLDEFKKPLPPTFNEGEFNEYFGKNKK